MANADRPNLISLRVKMLNNTPPTPTEMAALYELLLAADGTAADSEVESMQALNWRSVRAAVVANFDTSIPPPSPDPPHPRPRRRDMAKIVVSTEVYIEQANGDITKLNRVREVSPGDNPRYFAEAVEKAQAEVTNATRNAVIELFDDHREDR